MIRQVLEEIEVINFGLPDRKEGSKTTWYPDGRVVVEYPSGYDPFSDQLSILTVDKNGETMPIWRYQDNNFRLRLREFRETGEVPRANLA